MTPTPSSPRRIGAAIARVRAATKPQTLLAAVQEAWPQAVGEQIAAQAQPIAERDGTITVSCRAATWAEELDMLQDDLLRRLNQTLEAGRRDSPSAAAGRVRSLRFTAGGAA
jgi:predicted nucleic acid-binding Zn ribbon protein